MKPKAITTTTFNIQAAAMLSIFVIFLLSFPRLTISVIDRLQLPSPVVGPESLAFDSRGQGPYTGVSDGRVLKWQGPSLGFTDFAVTSQNRSKQLCNGSSNPALEPTCGRPLGLGFNYGTGDLYIADAYFGLVMVGSNGGVATQLDISAENLPFRFINGLDIDQTTGIVYFTDASARFQRRDANAAILSGDRTGRLMKYDPKSKVVTVLLRNIAFAAGVAVSKDGSYVLVTETITSRILRFWLHGPRANTSDVFAQLLAPPDNIKRNSRGEFWVALNIGKEERQKHAISTPGNDEAKLDAGVQPLPIAVSEGLRLSEHGRVLEVVVFSQRIVFQSISEVQEYNGTLYLGSLALPYVGNYRV